MKPEVEVEKGPVIEETQENKNDKNIGKAKLQAYAGGKLWHQSFYANSYWFCLDLSLIEELKDEQLVSQN